MIRITPIAALILVLLHVPASAQDKVFWVKPVPPIEELTDGKIKTGGMVTPENVEVVKDLLSESLYRNIKDGGVLKINPTTPTSELMLPDLLAATIRNQGKAKVWPNGTVTTTDGGPWIGGFPIPEPKTAIEVMATRQYYQQDTQLDEWDNYWVNPAGQVYKKIVGQVGVRYMNGRVCEDPVPVVPGHEDELRRELILDLDPYDVRGLAVLSIIYNDQDRLPDAWGYIPVMRRVQRFSSGQRYDSLDGSDLRAGDIGAFADPLGMWNFKLVARKPFLSMITRDGNPIPEAGRDIALIKGKYPKDSTGEVRDTYIIEATPKDPSHIYSKKMLYIDSGTWYAVGDFYDQQGNLWIGWHTHFVRDDSPCGNYPRPTLFRLYNYQTGSGSFFNLYLFEQSPGPSKLPPEKFTLKGISTIGR